MKAVAADAIKAQLAEETLNITQKLEAAYATITEQSTTLKKLRQDLDSLKVEIDTANYVATFNEDLFKKEGAALSGDGGGYGVARTTLGPVVIRVDSVTPYLEGFKVKLWATVLIPVEVNGLKGSLSWIEKDPEVLKKDKTVYREKEFNAPGTFQVGRYGEIEVVLSPASAAALKKFSVSIQTDSISINRPYGSTAPR